LPHFTPREPIWRNVVKLINLKHAGYKIIIWTARHSNEYELVEKWMNHYDIPFDRIETGKTIAKKYVDDKAINSEEETWL